MARNLDRPFNCDQCSKLFTRSVTPFFYWFWQELFCRRRTYSSISVHVSIHRYRQNEPRTDVLQVMAVHRSSISNVLDVRLDSPEGLLFWCSLWITPLITCRDVYKRHSGRFHVFLSSNQTSQPEPWGPTPQAGDIEPPLAMNQESMDAIVVEASSYTTELPQCTSSLSPTYASFLRNAVLQSGDRSMGTMHIDENLTGRGHNNNEETHIKAYFEHFHPSFPCYIALRLPCLRRLGYWWKLPLLLVVCFQFNQKLAHTGVERRGEVDKMSFGIWYSIRSSCLCAIV